MFWNSRELSYLNGIIIGRSANTSMAYGDLQIARLNSGSNHQTTRTSRRWTYNNKKPSNKHESKGQ